MAREDEFRRVAEDVKALARSLARDVRAAVADARRDGYTAGDAVRSGLRDVVEEARRGVREGVRNPRDEWRGGGWRRGGWHGCCSGRHGWWGPAPSGRRRSGPPRWGPPGWGAPGSDVSGSGTAGSVPFAGRSGDPMSGASPPGAGLPPGAAGDAPAGGPGWPYHGPPWSGRQMRRRSGPPPVRRRWDLATLLGLLAALFGVAWLVGAVHITSVSLEAVVAVGLMMLGAALVITGRTDWSLSRRAWPVWLGIAMVLVLIATSNSFGLGGAGDFTFGDKTVDNPAPGKLVRGGFGDLTVDIPSAANTTYDVASVAGEVVIHLDGPAQVNAHVLAGHVCVSGDSDRRRTAGIGAQYHGVVGATSGTGGTAGTGGSPAPTTTVNVHEAFGQIVVDSPGTTGGGCG